MPSRTLSTMILVSFLGLSTLSAQVVSSTGRNATKITGKRYFPDDSYSGTPYLSEKFVLGEICFSNGITMDSILLRYNAYRDLLICYNPSISAQIVIDKYSVQSFDIIDEQGVARHFRQQYFNGYTPGYRFFEVLDEGESSLLALRSVTLDPCKDYRGASGRVKNSTYTRSDKYYIYESHTGYIPVSMRKGSLLSKFDKSNQKIVNKLLRENHVYVRDESGFIKAWTVIKMNEIGLSHQKSSKISAVE